MHDSNTFEWTLIRVGGGFRQFLHYSDWTLSMEERLFHILAEKSPDGRSTAVHMDELSNIGGTEHSCIVRRTVASLGPSNISFA